MGSGDTCLTLGRSLNIETMQLVSWNPELGRACEYMEFLVDYEICVSTPGGSSKFVRVDASTTDMN